MCDSPPSSKRVNVVGDCYLLHFDKPIADGHPCQHYLGWSENLVERLKAHKDGLGARLTQVAKERGIGWTLAAVWSGVTREFERKLKNRRNAPKMCPVCKAKQEAKDRRNARRRARYAARKAAEKKAA